VDFSRMVFITVTKLQHLNQILTTRVQLLRGPQHHP
jgi:hypothetical protein